MLPDRLNLSIGHLCWLSCPGCYSYFGTSAPDLDRFLISVRVFAQLGLRCVTLSGGDPLRIPRIEPFLTALRDSGARSIKLDTVGTSLLTDARQRARITSSVDILSVPLDGWSNESAVLFRTGRPRLHEETRTLLNHLATAPCRIYVNTVLHGQNSHGILRILDELTSVSRIDHWNVFQYTATDQSTLASNRAFELSHAAFATARETVLAEAARRALPFEIEFASNRDRLGAYLLVNSDGEAWMPDAHGATIRLGNIFGREAETLEAWRHNRSAVRRPALVAVA